jgi:hypothetical protein
MKETDVQKLVQLQATKLGAVTFRNNVGMGWVGKAIKKGDLTIIKNARPLHAGLCEGSSDLIGWTSIEVTPEMVGEKLAVFTAIELKSGRRSSTTEQTNFITNVKKAGGFAGVARDPSDVKIILENG